MAVRKFTLYNSLGESLNLLDNVDMWGMNPEGLGIQIQNEVTSAGAHFVLNARTLQVPQFSISMLYGIETGDAYKRYSEMVAFLEHTPITLEYKTDAGTWRRDCTLNELTKTEIKETGVMTESFRLDCLTPWYKEVTAQSDTREPISGDGKIYLPYDESAATYTEPPTGKVNKGSLVKYDGVQKYPGDGKTFRYLIIGCDSVETVDENANFLGVIEAEVYSSATNVALGSYVYSLTGDSEVETNLTRVVDGVSNVNTNYGWSLPDENGRCVMVIDLGEFQITESSRFKLDWGFKKTYKNLWAGFANYREDVAKLVSGNTDTDGIAGKDGVSIINTVIEYVGAVSGTSKPTSGWSTTIPTVPQGQYLWTRTTWTYTDGTTEQGYSAALMGPNGQAPVVHSAWSWSADGTDRFTTVYPRENLFTNSCFLNSNTSSGFIGISDEKYNGSNVALGKSNGISWQPIFGAQFRTPVLLSKGDKVTFQFAEKVTKARLDGTTNIISFIVEEYATSTGNRTHWSSSKNIISPVLNTWTKGTATYQIVGEDTKYIALVALFTTNLTGIETVSIASMKLEKGASPTIYTPAPSEDYANAYPLYAGTYTDYSETASTNPADYTWRRIIGESGKDGIAYKTEFGDVATSDTWLSLRYPPALKTGYYMATRTLPYLDMRYMSYYAETIEPLQYDLVYDYEYKEGLNPDLMDNTFSAYTYDYIYEEIVDGTEGVFKVNNESMHMGLQDGSPVRIEITGPCENPYWQVIQDYKIVATDGFKVSIPADYKLVVDSSPGKQEAMLVSPSGDETKMYQYQQLNYTNFVMLPKGRSTLLFFNCKNVKFIYREERVVV